MNFEELNYINLINTVLTTGVKRNDRTGVGTLSIFGSKLEYDLSDNRIPLLTSRKMFIKGIIEELLFFIRGNSQTKTLEENGVNIWKHNTSREFLDKRGLLQYPEGLMGPMYGVNWRGFGKQFDKYGEQIKGKDGVDQLQNCFNLIKNDPMSRRIIVSAYNPEVSNQSVLDPCHLFYQFYVDGDKLNCQFVCRSVDLMLGYPYNIVSYSILTLLMAKATGLKPGKIIFIGGDTHIYLSHIEAAKKQIAREPYQFPKIEILKSISSISDIEQLSFQDFKLVGYNYYEAIKMDMAI